MIDDSHYVAVTGIGMICPLGLSTSECWKNMVDGKSGIRRITRFNTSDCLTKIGGELPPKYYEIEKEEFSKRFFKQTASTSRLGLLCAKEAIRDSGLEIEKLDPYRCSVISGSGGFILEEGKSLNELKINKFGVLQEMVNAISAWISIKYGLKGPSFNVATACGSGGFALWMAFDYVRSKRIDVCVALGLDMMVTRESIHGFNQLMALSEENDFPEKASRPFDRRRSGFVLANGGCAIILENLDRARRRGANIYALVSGYGCTSEGFNIVAPEPGGKEMAKTISLALQHAGISKEKVGYINAHGTSTFHNDRCETQAIKTVFGQQAYKLAVSSQKSMIGHTIGGAGAIEFGVTSLSLYHGIITPTINYEEPDPECDLDYVPNKAREVNNLEVALSNSFGFGGHNCSIVLERYKNS